MIGFYLYENNLDPDVDGLRLINHPKFVPFHEVSLEILLAENLAGYLLIPATYSVYILLNNYLE